MGSRVPYRDTWTHVDGMTEREYHIRYHAHREEVTAPAWELVLLPVLILLVLVAITVLLVPAP